MLTDFHIAVQAQRPIQWPHFAGGRIRGAWGRALRQAACITGKPTCEGCSVRTRCAYGAVFDPAAPQQPLHPSFQNGIPAYIVQPPALGARQLRVGESVRFTLRLLPGAQRHHQLIEHVLQNAVNQHLFDPGDFTVQSLERHDLMIDDILTDPPQLTTSGIPIRWLTPLRLQRQGKPLFRPQDLDATTLTGAAWRRYLQWVQLTGQPTIATPMPFDAARLCRLDTGRMEWHDVSRYSNTQHRHLPLGGLLGDAILTGPDDALRALWPIFRFGELLHLGKETVFGLGRYQLQIAR